MTTEQNKAVIRRAADAQDRGDIEGFLALLGDDYRLYFPGQPEALDRDGHAQVVGGFRAAFPDGRHVIDDQVAEGDRVVTRGTWQGTHLGASQGLPPTGRQVNTGWTMFARVADGKLAEIRLHADMLGMMQQLGAIPSPEPAPATA